MSNEIREYAVTYGTKIFLMNKKWSVIAYNPPGSQGTFTIPNPNKDGRYRGQSGSESPDVIAVKNNHILIVECKPRFDEEDAIKLDQLAKNSKKMEILETLIRKVCEANGIKLSKKLNYIFALAYEGAQHKLPNLGFISVNVKKTFDITYLIARSSYEDEFASEIIPASNWSSDTKGLFEN